jgi:hypothetical protein
VGSNRHFVENGISGEVQEAFRYKKKAGKYAVKIGLTKSVLVFCRVFFSHYLFTALVI